MLDSLHLHLTTSGFMPHGMCYLWQPGVLWLHIISDALITLAYFSIPFTLLNFVRRRKDLEFDWMFVCFAVFIVACGTTHLMEIWTIWNPTYWLSGTIKAITAMASVPTAILLVKLVPDALRLPSPAALQTLNAELLLQIAERERAEQEVRRLNTDLESRVAQRTQQLKLANDSLLKEVRERELVEQSALASQRLLRAVIDNSTALVYVKDAQGHYLLINRRFEQLFKVNSAEFVGRTDYDIFDKEIADSLRRTDADILAATSPLEIEEVASLGDGVRTYFSIKSPLHDPAGVPYAICGISTDITERKLAQRRLRQQLGQLELLNRITHAIAERQDLLSILRVVLRRLEDDLPVDFGCVCEYDATAAQLQVIGVGAKSHAAAAKMELAERARIDIDRNGLSRCVSGQVICEPDITASVLAFPQQLAAAGLGTLVAAPLPVDGNVFGVLIVARRKPHTFTSDECEFLRQLSEQVALAIKQSRIYEALQQAYDDLRQSQMTTMQQERLRALGQMASGIAHDINNAISPITLYTESLLEREPGLSAQARQQLSTIHRAIEDVADTVARLKEFYRLREPQLVLESIDLNRIVTQVVELTRARWSNQPQQAGIVVDLQTELGNDLPPTRGAQHEIRDALTNLIFNAVDAMPKGGTLKVRTGSFTPPDGDQPPRAFVEVADSGVGMDEETRRRCLEPFFTTKGERGTGLGLAMVYGMVQRHSAEVSIDSTLGAGTTVRIAFVPSAAIDMPAESPALPLARTSGLHILIVDDDPLVLESMRFALQGDGHSVTSADGGQAGIDAFAKALRSERPFAVVITDLGMPYVDGRRLASAVRQLSPATPIVLLTGWGQRLVNDNDVPAEVDRVLGKPPKLSDLRTVLAELTIRRTDAP